MILQTADAADVPNMHTDINGNHPRQSPGMLLIAHIRGNDLQRRGVHRRAVMMAYFPAKCDTEI